MNRSARVQKEAGMKQICGDCLHYNACAAWNIGSLANTDAGNCINFEHIHLYDSVEVVRCKDCAVPHNHWTGCPRMNGTIMRPDDYCSHGERKEV